MNLPNKLTVGRMIAVPFFVAAFMIQYYMIAFIRFIGREDCSSKRPCY